MTDTELLDAIEARFRKVLAESRPAAPAPSAPPSTNAGGAVFPPYGRSKGQPVSGASMGDLEFYRNGCQRTLGDPAKSRWHDKERALLAAIEAEIIRQKGQQPGTDYTDPSESWGSKPDAPPPGFDERPPPDDNDVPF